LRKSLFYGVVAVGVLTAASIGSFDTAADAENLGVWLLRWRKNSTESSCNTFFIYVHKNTQSKVAIGGFLAKPEIHPRILTPWCTPERE
jgi:hypothetical protein